MELIIVESLYPVSGDSRGVVLRLVVSAISYLPYPLVIREEIRRRIREKFKKARPMGEQ